jgi:hypothetical protein
MKLVASKHLPTPDLQAYNCRLAAALWTVMLHPGSAAGCWGVNGHHVSLAGRLAHNTYCTKSTSSNLEEGV